MRHLDDLRDREAGAGGPRYVREGDKPRLGRDRPIQRRQHLCRVAAGADIGDGQLNSRRLRSAHSGPSAPECSSDVVTTRSPACQSIAHVATFMPSGRGMGQRHPARFGPEHRRNRRAGPRSCARPSLSSTPCRPGRCAARCPPARPSPGPSRAAAVRRCPCSGRCPRPLPAEPRGSRQLLVVGHEWANHEFL